MSTLATVLLVLIALNVPIYALIGKIFFGDWEGFWEALRFWITPEIFSIFKGEYFEDVWAELKLGLWAIVCGAAVYGEFWVIREWGWFGL